MAFLQSDPSREPFLHAPASVLWLIGAMVAVYLVVTLVPLSDQVMLQFELVPARYSQGSGLFGLVVPPLSHMFIHANVGHLIVNCVWLLAFGPIITRRYGPIYFFAFFLGSGLAGAAAFVAAAWGSTDAGIGASGAIAGLMAAGFRLLRWPGQEGPGPRLTPIFSKPILMFSGLWLASNAVFALMGGLPEAAAHIGGYLFGLFAIEGVEVLHLARARRRIKS